jgi:acetyl/propionyl-CoA carboxylase alpha subunit
MTDELRLKWGAEAALKQLSISYEGGNSRIWLTNTVIYFHEMNTVFQVEHPT